MKNNINKFLELFSDFDLVVTKSGKYSESDEYYREVVETELTLSEQDLKRNIKRLEKEYSAAKRAWKAGKLQREELFDYEWRLYELKEELKKIQGE
jgi:hypothetical protein